MTIKYINMTRYDIIVILGWVNRVACKSRSPLHIIYLQRWDLIYYTSLRCNIFLKLSSALHWFNIEIICFCFCNYLVFWFKVWSNLNGNFSMNESQMLAKFLKEWWELLEECIEEPICEIFKL